MKPAQFNRTFVVAILAAASCAAQAADWSDTSLSYRYGTKFAEPFNGQEIAKNIVNLSSASGYKYGKNFFSVDFLLSNEADPSSAGAAAARTKRTRCTATRSTWARSAAPTWPGARCAASALTGGFDFNTKTDAGYNSKKRMLVLGPTVMFDVPGFLDVSLLALNKSNAPYNSFSHVATPRYRYKTHAMLTAAWGIPFQLRPATIVRRLRQLYRHEGQE